VQRPHCLLQQVLKYAEISLASSQRSAPDDDIDFTAAVHRDAGQLALNLSYYMIGQLIAM
jgi:hypothetical protein